MYDKNLMEMAKNRYFKKNTITEYDFKKGIRDFILYSYINCDPAVYGANWSKKLLMDIRSYGIKNLYRVLDSSDCGDIAFSFPETNYWDRTPTYVHPVHKTTHHVKNSQCSRRYYEVKLSYLGKSGSYSIRNLRKYQKLDGYIFTLIDCENDFDIKFIFITHDDLYHHSGLTFSYMNGTQKQNKTNSNVGVGSTFKKGSQKERNLLILNRLNGTSFQDLMNFLTNENDNVIKEFSDKWESGEICTPSVYDNPHLNKVVI
jgi:hypothetical protein